MRRPHSPRFCASSSGLWAALALVIALATPTFAQPPAGATGRAAARQILEGTYRYDPAVRQRALEQTSVASDVVSMERVTVLESKLQTLLERYLLARRRAADAVKPSLENGRSIARQFGENSVELGVIPYRELLAEEARFKSDGPQVAQWTLASVQD
ncbi:MAG TPA: hypothetical protein VHF69_07430 [Candidatus Synoicihabitans sp.]|nr:hypothetical protein [Candidatus Synoicihabitans sp.]